MIFFCTLGQSQRWGSNGRCLGMALSSWQHGRQACHHGKIIETSFLFYAIHSQITATASILFFYPSRWSHQYGGRMVVTWGRCCRLGEEWAWRHGEIVEIPVLFFCFSFPNNSKRFHPILLYPQIVTKMGIKLLLFWGSHCRLGDREGRHVVMVILQKCLSFSYFSFSNNTDNAPLYIHRQSLIWESGGCYLGMALSSRQWGRRAWRHGEIVEISFLFFSFLFYSILFILK